MNCPFAIPIRGPVATAPIGTSRATGRPLRAMMISATAPVSTASTSRESCVLASSMLTVVMARLRLTEIVWSELANITRWASYATAGSAVTARSAVRGKVENVDQSGHTAQGSGVRRDADWCLRVSCSSARAGVACRADKRSAIRRVWRGVWDIVTAIAREVADGGAEGAP